MSDDRYGIPDGFAYPPGTANLNFQDNDGPAISEPGVDFEDSGSVIWTLADDPVNGRMVVSAEAGGGGGSALSDALGYSYAVDREYAFPTLNNGFIPVLNSAQRSLAFAFMPYLVPAGTVITGVALVYLNNSGALPVGGAFQVGIADTTYTILAASGDAKSFLVSAAGLTGTRVQIRLAAPYVVPADTSLFIAAFAACTSASTGSTIPLLDRNANVAAFAKTGGFPVASGIFTNTSGGFFPAALAPGYSFLGAFTAGAAVAYANRCIFRPLLEGGGETGCHA